MSLTIEERFAIDAPVERVWSCLTDPRQALQCLPGARLMDDENARTFAGRITVQVGPMTATYRGRARLTEIDAETRTVRLTAEGKEKGGSGTAKVRLTSEVKALPGGGSEVAVHAQVDLRRKLAQFGRGVIDATAQRLFHSFADGMRATLEGLEPALLDRASLTLRYPSLADTLTRIPVSKEMVEAAALGAVPLASDDTAIATAVSPAPALALPRLEPFVGPSLVHPARMVPLVVRAVWELTKGVAARVTGRPGPKLSGLGIRGSGPE